MREIGLNPRTGGGKRGGAKRLQLQMHRLIDARISFKNETDTYGTYLHMDVSASSEFWWNPKKTNQANLWESWIELGEKFYEAVTLSSVPVDLRALKRVCGPSGPPPPTSAGTPRTPPRRHPALAQGKGTKPS